MKKNLYFSYGASNINEINHAVKTILKNNKDLCVMQCNTNYTGNLENFKYINLEVLKLLSVNFKYNSRVK